MSFDKIKEILKNNMFVYTSKIFKKSFKKTLGFSFNKLKKVWGKITI